MTMVRCTAGKTAGYGGALWIMGTQTFIAGLSADALIVPIAV